MTKEVNVVEYDMSEFLRSCLGAYRELAGVGCVFLGRALHAFYRNEGQSQMRRSP